MQKIISVFSRSSTRQVGLYTITGALAKVVSFAALPFFVNTLSEGDIGILNIFSSTIVFLTPIISMGVLYSISVEYFKVPKEQYANIFSTGMLIPLVFSILLVPLLFLFYPFLSETFNFQPAFIWLIPACLLLNFFFEAFVILLRMEQKVKFFSLVSILKIVLEITVAVLLISYVSKTWLSRAFGYFVAGCSVSLFFFYYTIKSKFLVAKINLQALRRELSFGLSGLLLQTAVFFIGTSDKFFVMATFGKEQAGFYSVAATFAAIQFIVCTSLIQYLQPILFKAFSENSKWQRLRGMYTKYIFAMGATFILLLGATYIAYHLLLKPSYVDTIHYFYILSVGALIWSVSNIFLQYIIYTKNKKVIGSVAIMAIAISTGVNFIASRYFGIVGLCVAQIITNLLVLTITLRYNQKMNYFS